MEASSAMADEEAPGNGGGVHDVNAQEFQFDGQHQAREGDGGSSRMNSVGPNDLQNIRMLIDIRGETVEIPLKGKLILQNSGPPQDAAGDAAPGNAGQGESAQDAEDEEFLDKMRGWLMTVGTLFVTMAFHAALEPPAWLRTTDFLRLSQSEIDKWGHRHHGASHAAAAVGPARFAPSPSPRPQAAGSATAGLSARARAYMYCNYCTFGSSLALVLVLMLTPRQTKFTMRASIFLLVIISIFVFATVVLGTAEDERFTMIAIGFMYMAVGFIQVWVGFSMLWTALSERIAYFWARRAMLWTALSERIACFWARRAGGPSPRP